MMHTVFYNVPCSYSFSSATFGIGGTCRHTCPQRLNDRRAERGVPVFTAG